MIKRGNNNYLFFYKKKKLTYDTQRKNIHKTAYVYVIYQHSFDVVNLDDKRNELQTKKHAFITWLVMRDRMMTRDKLITWGIDVPPTCLLCGVGNE